MATRIAVMDGGVIQQIGTPDEIYERPANLFVARFVGSPPMNILETTIDLTGNRVVAIHRPTGVEMDLSDYAFARQPAAGMKVLVGLRPEHFSIGRPNGSEPAADLRPAAALQRKDRQRRHRLPGGGRRPAGRACRPFADRRAAGEGEPVRAIFPGRPVQRLRCRNRASNLGRAVNREKGSETMFKQAFDRTGLALASGACTVRDGHRHRAQALPFMVERERDRRAQRDRQGVRSARQQDHRDGGAARAGRVQPAGQPDRRRHAAERVHQLAARPLSRSHQARPRAAARRPVRQDRRDAELSRDGAASRSRSTARSARFRPASISTA